MLQRQPPNTGTSTQETAFTATITFNHSPGCPSISMEVDNRFLEDARRGITTDGRPAPEWLAVCTALLQAAADQHLPQDHPDRTYIQQQIRNAGLWAITAVSPQIDI